MTPEDLDRLLSTPSEHEHLEFKAAHGGFNRDKVGDYCSARYNEGGGRLLLGVSDKAPRRVVGTTAFDGTLQQVKHELLQLIGIRIDVEEIEHPDGRVLVFTAPPRLRGHALSCRGRYWMRSGESLVAMTDEQLRKLLDLTLDFSAEICGPAELSDLDPVAIQRFRSERRRHRPGLQLSESDRQLLEDAELLVDGRVTFAALILLANERGLKRHLGNAEIIFEYRNDEAAIEYAERRDITRGFLAVMDDIWALINLWNTEHQYQDGLFRRSVRAFNESAVREALLNAVSHRDYRNGGSVFIKQFPDRLSITSPGGFPEGISAENLLYRQSPRNRRLATALQHCGLVERSGQGADRMFAASLREGKLLPDYSTSDAYHVALDLYGQVRRPAFVRFIERLANESGRPLGLEDLLVLDAVDRGQPVAPALRERARLLTDLGAIEKRPRNQYILGARFYADSDDQSEYTRRRGLDRETNKALLLDHIRRADEQGSPMEELLQVLPALTREQVKTLVSELRDRGDIVLHGAGRGARWHPAPKRLQ